MGPKKGGKDKGKPPPPPPKGMVGPPPKPKRPPPPPACFNSEDLARFKEMFKAHDEENIDKVLFFIINQSKPKSKCLFAD